MMTREEAVKHLTTWIYTDFENMPKQVLEASNIALAALRAADGCGGAGAVLEMWRRS